MALGQSRHRLLHHISHPGQQPLLLREFPDGPSMHSQFGRGINSELGKIKIELDSEEEGIYFTTTNNDILDKIFNLVKPELNKTHTLILPTTFVGYQLAISNFDGGKFHLVSSLPGP